MPDYIEGQGSNEVLSYHDDPPQYDSQSELLTSVIENVHNVRIWFPRYQKLLEKAKVLNKKYRKVDASALAEVFLDCSTLYAEGLEIATKLREIFE